MHYVLLYRWDYAVRHRVQLPDEYDEIFNDIEPFWGIDPHDLAETQQELETRDGLLTVQKTDDSPNFEIARSNIPETQGFLTARVNDILALVRDVESELPPMRVTFSPRDEPDMVSDWRIKNMALEAAAKGTSMSYVYYLVTFERIYDDYSNHARGHASSHRTWLDPSMLT